jgi:hypothetical protein
VFWAFPRFGKIGIRIFQDGILIAMPKLLLQAGVPRVFVILSFRGTLPRILIARAMWHASTSGNNSYQEQFSAEASSMKMG